MKRKSARNLVFRTLASLLMVLVLFTGVSCTEEREPLSTAERCEGSETVLAETSSDQEAPSAEVSEEETTEENGVPTSQETVSSPSPEPPPSSSATPEQTPFDPSSVLSLVPSYVGDPFYIGE